MKLIFNFNLMPGGESVVYNTRQRELIFELLMENCDKHMTADDVANSLLYKGNAVGKSTVYRYLDKLVESGEVRKYIVEEGKSACYQYVGRSERCSNHFKCSGCGELLHIDCEYLDRVGEHVFEQHGFRLSNEKTVLYGTCLNCRKIEKPRG
jgi:Fur family ferric uptake transcriptional regulator